MLEGVIFTDHLGLTHEEVLTISFSDYHAKLNEACSSDDRLKRFLHAVSDEHQFNAF
jgi:hypothetical protein